mmetsp:Transcript_3141/g.11389  ORF Transcript_3141/g.11389 Transcript_3141/m.11389 type:complete len:290 (-) Transcript_3141:789-1658(-)
MALLSSSAPLAASASRSWASASALFLEDLPSAALASLPAISFCLAARDWSFFALDPTGAPLSLEGLSHLFSLMTGMAYDGIGWEEILLSCSRITCLVLAPGSLICLARSAQCSVLAVSPRDKDDGVTVAIMAVWHCPPSESLSIWVSLEFLKGICFFPSTRARMQLDRDRRDLLMFAPSTLLDEDFFSFAMVLSDPARSTSESFPVVVLPPSLLATLICRSAWLLLDVLLHLVDSVLRCLFPWCRSLTTSSAELVFTSLTPLIVTPLPGSSRSSKLGPFGFSRSLRASL